MSPPDERELLAIRAEFPAFRIVRKEGDPFSEWVGRILRVLTFGAQSAYVTRYHTVLGNTLYVPRSWDECSAIDRAVVLRHERIHLRQFRRYTRVGMSLLYLIPILPMGLAWGRARLEWEAYRETIRATAELRGIEAARDPELERGIVRQFSSGAYGWMWPFPKTVTRWVRAAVEECALEAAASKDPAP